MVMFEENLKRVRKKDFVNKYHAQVVKRICESLPMFIRFI